MIIVLVQKESNITARILPHEKLLQIRVVQSTYRAKGKLFTFSMGKMVLAGHWFWSVFGRLSGTTGNSACWTRQLEFILWPLLF